MFSKMNKIIKEVKVMRGQRMSRSMFNIICYADDAHNLVSGHS